MLRHVTMLDDEVGQTVGSSVLKKHLQPPFKIVVLLRQFNLHYSDQGIVNSGYFKMVSFFYRFRGQLTKIVIYCAAGELHKYMFKTRLQLHPSR